MKPIPCMCGCCQCSIEVSFWHQLEQRKPWSGGRGTLNLKKGGEGGTTSIYRTYIGISIYLLHLLQGPPYLDQNPPPLSHPLLLMALSSSFPANSPSTAIIMLPNVNGFVGDLVSSCVEHFSTRV